MSSGHAQPNVPGRGITASYGLRFWLLVVAIGAGTGLAGAALIELLRAVQHLAWNYSSGPFLDAAEHASSARRVIVLAIGGLVAGVGTIALAGRGGGEVSESLWLRGAHLPLLGSIAKGIHSIVVVALGASLGREAAPQLAGAALASTLSERLGVPTWQRRLLVACGAGAGMAAVYNVPLGGALFTAEIMMGVITLPVALPALACSGIATATAWLYLPRHATYPGVPSYQFTVPLLVWALLAGPLIGLVASGYIRLIGWVTHHAATGRAAIFAPIAAFGILGLIGFAYPQLFGNGKDMADDAFLGTIGFTVLLPLTGLKPLVTALCLGSGASGGLFTPTLSTGAVLGGAAGIAWSLAWPGSPEGAYAVVGAAAMLGAAMQAPLTGLVLILELTSGGFGILIPIVAATVTATVVARQVDGYSIYTARLRARSDAGGVQRAGVGSSRAPRGRPPGGAVMAKPDVR
jgi:chloride channel protein, CIC family